LLLSLSRAGAGLKSARNKHRHPNGHDQTSSKPSVDSDGKGSCAHLARAERGNDSAGFSLTVSLGSRSLGNQEVSVPKSPKRTLGCWRGWWGPSCLCSPTDAPAGCHTETAQRRRCFLGAFPTTLARAPLKVTVTV